jgi:hypothetical protein
LCSDICLVQGYGKCLDKNSFAYAVNIPWLLVLDSNKKQSTLLSRVNGLFISLTGTQEGFDGH